MLCYNALPRHLILILIRWDNSCLEIGIFSRLYHLSSLTDPIILYGLFFSSKLLQWEYVLLNDAYENAATYFLIRNLHIHKSIASVTNHTFPRIYRITRRPEWRSMRNKNRVMSSTWTSMCLFIHGLYFARYFTHWDMLSRLWVRPLSLDLRWLTQPDFDFRAQCQTKKSHKWNSAGRSDAST